MTSKKKMWLNAAPFIPIAGVFISNYHCNKYNYQNKALRDFGINNKKREGWFLLLQIFVVSLLFTKYLEYIFT